MSVNAQPYSLTNNTQRHYPPSPASPTQLSNKKVTAGKANNAYLNSSELSELKKLSKFELFGGRLKQNAVRGLIHQMGPSAIKKHWNLTTQEYSEAKISAFGDTFRNMPAFVKKKVLNSRYGFDDFGVERNVSPNNFSSHRRENGRSGGVGRGSSPIFQKMKSLKSRSPRGDNISGDNESSYIQRQQIQKFTTPRKKEAVDGSAKSNINASREAESPNYMSYLRQQNQRNYPESKENKDRSRSLLTTSNRSQRSPAQVLLDRRRSLLSKRQNLQLKSGMGIVERRRTTPARKNKIHLNSQNKQPKVSSFVTPRKDFTPTRKFHTIRKNSRSQPPRKSQGLFSGSKYKIPMMFDSYSKNNSSNATPARRVGFGKRERNYRSITPRRRKNNMSTNVNCHSGLKGSVLENYSERLKTPKRTPRRSQKMERIKKNEKKQYRQGVVAITHTPKNPPSANQSHPNAVETSQIFQLFNSRRPSQPSYRRSTSRKAAEISQYKLRQNIQNSNLNSNLVTSVEYRPDNSPTKDTFLRNRYRGGSNEHEKPENQKSQVYFALPKTFYDSNGEREEEIEHRGKKAIARRYSPDFSRSNLAAAILEASDAENCEAGRVIENSVVY